MEHWPSGPVKYNYMEQWPSLWSNGLVVTVLDSQSRGSVFKTTGRLQG